jgi:hypothetical protein
MATQNLKVRSGNRIEVRFDNVRIGLVQSVRLNDDYAPEPASGIGDIHVQEWVPTQARHSLSVSAMILFTGSLINAGIAAENGDAVLQGLVFDIVVLSKDDGTVLRKYIGCSWASGDVEISKHAILVNSGTFNALDVQGTAF